MFFSLQIDEWINDGELLLYKVKAVPFAISENMLIAYLMGFIPRGFSSSEQVANFISPGKVV